MYEVDSYYRPPPTFGMTYPPPSARSWMPDVQPYSGHAMDKTSPVSSPHDDMRYRYPTYRTTGELGMHKMHTYEPPITPPSKSSGAGDLTNLDYGHPPQLGNGSDEYENGDSDGSGDQDSPPGHGVKRSADDSHGSSGAGMTKKTKGRVKIKMEFIDNKLRRYTTFSKRKTGIMKKAYELSTLTGTQVMLLVASETGHVYTFATRKLQPMITSEAGKALIQTCLNSPDPPSQGQATGHGQHDQRMSVTGYEETDLTYSTEAEDNMKMQKPTMFTVANVPGTSGDGPGGAAVNTATSIQMGSAGFPITSYMAPVSTTAGGGKTTPTMQIPGSFTAVLPPGTPLLSQVQQGTSQSQQIQQQQQQQQQQMVYRVNGQPAFTSGSQSHQQSVVYTMTQAGGGDSQQDSSPIINNQNTSTSMAPTSGSSTLTGHVMYQTPQGVVYAAPTSMTEAGVVLNYPQGPSAIPVPQQQVQDQVAPGGVQQVVLAPTTPVQIQMPTVSLQPLQPTQMVVAATPSTESSSNSVTPVLHTQTAETQTSKESTRTSAAS
ncbi:serum response factor-like isoform X3 [Branchiostoma lanceolatum]|uniref:serum response factor-like isoform X3 n=1 Tax=Branchiostoma lanceolatum TaxID=7740 RepID=UPI003452083B